MKTWQKYLLITITTVGVATAATEAFAPKDTDTYRQQKLEQGVEDLADTNEMSTDRMRQEGMDVGEAHRQESLKPGERRPGRPPRLRFP